MSKRDVKLLLSDIIESIDRINCYVKGITKEEFLKDNKTLDAVTRNFEIAGEAASKIPAEFCLTYPDVQWKKIVGLRNRIIHDCFEVDYDIVWEIINKNLPELFTQLKKIIAELS